MQKKIYWISIYWISKKYKKNSRNTVDIRGKEEKLGFRDLELVGEPDARLSATSRSRQLTRKCFLVPLQAERKRERKPEKKKMRAEIAVTSVAQTNQCPSTYSVILHRLFIFEIYCTLDIMINAVYALSQLIRGNNI